MEDRKSCEDIDECASHGICHQNCDNVKGSFKCSCTDGFQLEPDRRTCKVMGTYVCLCCLYSSGKIHHQSFFTLKRLISCQSYGNYGNFVITFVQHYFFMQSIFKIYETTRIIHNTNSKYFFICAASYIKMFNFEI